MSTVLARGVLNWDRSERVSDRYGAVNFSSSRPDWRTDPSGNAQEDLGGAVKCIDGRSPLVGRRGRLKAVVIEARDSGHIGDMFHGVAPSRPDVGEVVILGEGTLFVDPPAYEGCSSNVGLRPDDGRDTLWLDIRALYRVHEQTVELHFEEV